jgi:hypothetical protein
MASSIAQVEPFAIGAADHELDAGELYLKTVEDFAYAA